jgi:hypothetical protein
MSDPSSSPRPDLPVIEVWEEPNRLWRWRYLEPSENGQPLAFRSNKDYDSRQAALASATTAYPGVTVLEPATADPTRSRPGARRRRLLLLLVLGLVVFLLWPRRQRPEPGRTSPES